jgi:hypothetical protein
VVLSAWSGGREVQTLGKGGSIGAWVFGGGGGGVEPGKIAAEVSAAA